MAKFLSTEAIVANALGIDNLVGWKISALQPSDGTHMIIDLQVLLKPEQKQAIAQRYADAMKEKS